MWLLGAQLIRGWVEPKPLMRRQDRRTPKAGGVDGYARVGGDGGRRFWVCATALAAEPRVCRGGRTDSGAGYWREYRDFYVAGSGVAAAAAGEKSPTVGAADHAWEALWEQLGRQRD